MKKSKILAPALAILCLSTAASVTGTVAWFASNNIVSATGMNVHANLPSSLVIADTIPNLSSRLVALDYASSATSLSPCTITSDDALPTDTVGTLQTIDSVTDGEIDQATGLPTAGGSIVYKPAVEGHDYVEYTSYIASAGAAIESNYSISAQIMNSRVGLSDTLSATSISFYVTPIDGSETYRGTLNLADLDAQKNDHSTAKNSVSIFSSTDGIISTYNNVSAKAVKIRMVVYFDGALLKDATHAYVASFNGDATAVNLDVDFTGIYA